MCLILPDGELLPKHVPSYSRIWHGELMDGFPLEKGLETARNSMDRRGRHLTPAHENLLRRVHSQTRHERETAFERRAAKVAG
jgi:hypothetical protein